MVPAVHESGFGLSGRGTMPHRNCKNTPDESVAGDQRMESDYGDKGTFVSRSKRIDDENSHTTTNCKSDYSKCGLPSLPCSQK